MTKDSLTPSSTAKSNGTKTPSTTKTHPWRVCPEGQHFVKTHPLKILPSKKNPSGLTVMRHGHCAHNPTKHKDLLSFDEIQEITTKHFKSVTTLPNKCKHHPQLDKYDREIAGWVQYWNEIFQPKQPLDPTLVKALIWSESSFDKEQETHTPKDKHGLARGLLQITDTTRNIIGDPKGELKNYHIPLTATEILDASANICAGVRWLFWKHATGKHRLHREITWIEAIAEFKGILRDYISNAGPSTRKIMNIIEKHYNELTSTSK